MELENNHSEQKPVYVLTDDGFGRGRILAREASVGNSSRIFYRSAEGVPFEWEMLPGTPKNPQEDAIPPLSPPPQIQSLGLPMPNLDYIDDERHKWANLKTSRIRSLKKMVKKGIKDDMLNKRKESKGRESSTFDESDGEFVESLKGSSFSSYSSSLSFSHNGRIMDSSRLHEDSIDGPFCCGPSYISAILDEGKTKIYYCSQHKTAISVEEDGSFISRVLSRDSVADPFSGPLNSGVTPAGVPFHWEMQPGTPKTLQENEFIPPPSPPPAVQSSTFPRPKVHIVEEENGSESTWKKPLVWIRENYGIKKNNKDVSFRRRSEEFDVSFRESGSSLSSVARSSKRDWRVSKMKRSLKDVGLSCSPWSRKEILVLAKRKFKSFTS